MATERVILAGDDERLLPLYERLRGGALADVVALGSSDPDSVTATLAAVSGLPLLTGADGEHAPAADFWVCAGPWRARAGATPVLDFADAEARWRPAMKRPATAPGAPAQPPPALRQQVDQALGASASPFTAFPRELQREIQRSQRYHLGFTLSILRVLDAAGRPLDERAFVQEPLRGLPGRLGRACDSWGLAREGYLLHLAPETLEQASALRRRLEAALLEALAGQPGGPWTVATGQARFPRDGEQGKALVELALKRLQRKLEHSGAEDDA